MKRMGSTLLVVLAVAAPAWGATRKITVKELTDMLTQLQQAKKSDADVAAELKQVELSEELTRATMNAMAGSVPGQLSTEQIYVLEARSAMLPPPASDVPTDSAPDAATQQAILTKAADYVNKTYGQLPTLTATKTTLRFQDNLEALAAGSGMHGSAKEVDTGSTFSNAGSYIRYINSTEAQVSSEHGAEKMPSEKDKTPWGANRMIALESPDPSLGAIFPEAQANGELKFARWESLNGLKVAVFSYAIPKKKSHLALNVCCFPESEQAGMVSFSSASTGSLNGGGGGGAKGNFQTNTAYTKFFKQTPSYHGELFVDPATGTVARLIAEADLKSTDLVHQVDTRIDYAPAKIGDQTLIVPVKTITDTEVVPNGDSGSGGYSIRHTLFTTEYKNYQLAGGH